MNTLDLDDDELATLLDELSLPQHRIVKDREKAFSWFNLNNQKSRHGHVIHEKPGSRGRRQRQRTASQGIFSERFRNRKT